MAALAPDTQVVILDIDTTDDPTHGQQQLTFFHGFYDQHMYHPLLVFDATSGQLVTALLRPHPHMTCWRKDAIPARFRYGAHPRVPPYLCLAEVGWTIVKTAPAAPFAGGNHGYDHQAPEMRALFVAHGPAFRPGVRLSSFSNTAVAPLLRELLGLPPGQGLDGDATLFRKAMR